MPRPMKRVRTTSLGRTVKSLKKRKTAPKEEIYQVEALIDSKKEGRTTKFLVKWVGYTEPTWEPRSNILDNDLIKDYEQMVIFKKWRSVTRKLKRSKLDKSVKIEKIVDSREEDGRTELLVKFQNSEDLEVHLSDKVAAKDSAAVKKFLGQPDDFEEEDEEEEEE